MRKLLTVLIFSVIALLVFSSCSPGNSSEKGEGGTSPDNGYPSGSVQFIYLFQDGKLYAPTYQDYDCIRDGDAYIRGSNFEIVGETVGEDNEEIPTEEMVASRLPVGTPIYRERFSGDIFILREDNMLMRCFEVKKTTPG